MQKLAADRDIEIRIPLDTDRTKVDDSEGAAPSYFRTSKGEIMEYRNCITSDEIENTYCGVQLKAHQLGVLHGKPAIRVAFKFTFQHPKPRKHRFRNAKISIDLQGHNTSANPSVGAFSPEVAFGSPNRVNFSQFSWDIVSPTWRREELPANPPILDPDSPNDEHEDHFVIHGKTRGEPANTLVWELTEDRESDCGCMGLPREIETAMVISYEAAFTMAFRIETDLGWDWQVREWVPNCWPMAGLREERVLVDPAELPKNDEEFDIFLRRGGLIRHTSFSQERAIGKEVMGTVIVT